MKRRGREHSAAIHGRLRQVLAELVALVERLEFLGQPLPRERAECVETRCLDAPKARGKPTMKSVGSSPESNHRPAVPSAGKPPNRARAQLFQGAIPRDSASSRAVDT